MRQLDSTYYLPLMMLGTLLELMAFANILCITFQGVHYLCLFIARDFIRYASILNFILILHVLFHTARPNYLNCRMGELPSDFVSKTDGHARILFSSVIWPAVRISLTVCLYGVRKHKFVYPSAARAQIDHTLLFPLVMSAWTSASRGTRRTAGKVGIKGFVLCSS